MFRVTVGIGLALFRGGRTEHGDFELTRVPTQIGPT
jgi:hypothetical protein